jgi:hypothetical protein
MRVSTKSEERNFKEIAASLHESRNLQRIELTAAAIGVWCFRKAAPAVKKSLFALRVAAVSTAPRADRNGTQTRKEKSGKIEQKASEPEIEQNRAKSNKIEQIAGLHATEDPEPSTSVSIPRKLRVR